MATKLKAKLEAAGYTVLLTKQNAMDTVTKRARAAVANNSQAALAVSIHTSGSSFGAYGQIYVQTLTSYRENIFGQKMYFTDPAVAALSAQYGQTFLTQRRAIEGPSVVVTVDRSISRARSGPREPAPRPVLLEGTLGLLRSRRACRRISTRALRAEPVQQHRRPCSAGGTPITPVIPVTRFEQTDERILTNGTSKSFAKPTASAASYGRCSSSDAAATINFVGTRLDVIGMKGTTTGIVDIYLDGKLKTTVNLASAVATYQVTLWSTDGLPNGLHRVQLVRNPGSPSGQYITLDAVDVVGTLTWPAPTITSVSPAAGDVAGGTSVLISGTGFWGVRGLTFGGTAATITSVDSTKQQITAIVPAHAEGVVPVQVRAAGGPSAETLADDYSYAVSRPTVRYDATPTAANSAFGYSGTWADFSTPSAYQASYRRSSTTGAYVVISFKGTRLDWIAMKGTTTGIADVYMDGASKATATIDLRAGAPSYQVNVSSTGLLPDGYHTVKIVKNPGSTASQFITIDAVEVAGNLVGAKRTEDNASPTPFLWSPAQASWTTGTTTSTSGGTYKYINTSGAAITFNFTGVGLDLIAKTAPSYGNLTVTLDGVSKTVSLYSSTTVYKKTVWSSGYLIPGNHTVVIKRAGTKSASSTGYTVDFDAAVLTGEWR